MIKHIVLWKINPTETRSREENVAEMRARLLGLVGKVSQIRDFEVATNIQSGDMASDIGLYSTFDSMADLEAYAVHPDHLEVVAFCKGVVAERRVWDFEV